MFTDGLQDINEDNRLTLAEIGDAISRINKVALKIDETTLQTRKTIIQYVIARLEMHYGFHHKDIMKGIENFFYYSIRAITIAIVVVLVINTALDIVIVIIININI